MRIEAALEDYLVQLEADLIAEVERRELEERSNLLPEVAHGRTATSGAELLSGIWLFTQFARNAGVITPEEEQDLLERGREAILITLRNQAQFLGDAKPELIFLEQLGAALQSGAAHLADRETGEVPEDPSGPDESLARLVGWRKTDSTGEHDGYWRSQGRLVGWVEQSSGSLFLIPSAAYQQVQRMGDEGGVRVTLGQRMLWKALDEGGYLVEKDGDRRTKKVRAAGKTRNALHLRLRSVFVPPDVYETHGTPSTMRRLQRSRPRQARCS